MRLIYIVPSMDRYNRPLRISGAIRLYLGCNCRRHKVDIKLLRSRMVEYYEYDIERLKIRPTDITAVGLGPRTVVELYESANLYGKKRLIINPSFSDEKKVDIGCVEDHQIWEGDIRSFRMYSYDYFYKLNSTRYCDSNEDCSENEYCLCPDGRKHPEWCPTTKRRCMPVSKYIQSNKPKVGEHDLVDTQCMSRRLSKCCKNELNFNKIKDLATYCKYDKNIKLVERFGKTNQNTTNIVLLVVVFLMFYYFWTN